MEKVADLVDAGGGEETEDLPNLASELNSYLDEQKEKPSELGIIDSDILELANQVGDEIENSVDESNIASELSFLEGAEAKVEASEVEDDPGLAFLVGDGKMEVDEEELSFLEQQEMSNSEYEEGSEGMEDSEDEEEEDEESGEEEDSDEKIEEDYEKKSMMDKQEDDETVFGQVSFYDEEPEPKSTGSVADTNSLLEDSSVPKKKKQKKTKKSKAQKRKAGDAAEGSAGKPKKKRRKKRQKKSKEDGEEDEDEEKLPKAGASQLRRKNIRSIMSEKDLDKDMLSAQNEERERQRRLMELKKAILKENASAVSAAAATSTATMATATTSTDDSAPKTVSASTETPAPKEKDSQLKSLLQVAEEEAEKEAESKDRKQQEKETMKAKKETRETSPPSDVITLSSDSDDSDDLDDEDSDGVMVVPSDEDEDDEEEAEDVNNAGAHIDDTLNLPDPDGRVKINIGHPSEDPDIYLAPQIAQAIRPHQIGGVRFLYDNLVESSERFKTSPGFGCILAHSMGLGKTIQLISFIDIFIRCTGGKRVLCIVPINTLQNWLAEFNYWLPDKEKLLPDDDLTQHRIFPLYVINDTMKTTAARAAVLTKWKENGGVLVLGYEMFRLLSSKKVAPTKKKSRSKKQPQPEVIDVEEEDKNKSLMIDMHSTLVDPGPDLVMCDEGHRIKNSSAAISQSLKQIKTRRRVVLTGYPVQNNLMEYWCMVDFVRPSFLGTKTEFSNMFERPIMNGQCMDSTAQDKKVMRHRSYVLHNLLEGFVQRRGHTVLKMSLPPKSEHVFLIRLSPIQRKIYCEFMNAISESGLCSWANNNPLKAFAVCCKIWNHPDVLHEVITQRTADKDNDLDIDTGEGSRGGKKKSSAQKSQSAASASSTPSSTPAPSAAPGGTNPTVVTVTPPTPLTPSASTTSLTSMTSEGASDKNPITYDWAENVMKDYIPGLLENSGKLVLMKGLIEECLRFGDKVLVFSQSLLTLNKIEEFFGRLMVPRPELNENWSRNRTYLRLDGSTSGMDREKLINQFNDPEGCAWMFLLSTKAGCLGINLVGANRVIVVDASWNPCHDCQAVCRVYRFGQIKNSYVYRLVTDNTLEKRIYDRQISKQGMSDRIIDDMNIENKFTRRQVENLLDFEDQDFPIQDFSNAETKYGLDPVLVKVLKDDGKWLTKQPFTHESLLIDRKELRMSKREKRLAKEGYARDKRMNVTYTRPSYAAYYPQQGVFPNRLPLNSSYAAFRRGPIVRPIASVRPIISASAQNGAEKIKQFGGQPLRPGVTIHQVITTTEILLPGTNTGTQAGGSGNKIGAGQKILVIKTPKGVYIRTNDGKMFAVRSKGAGMGLDVGGSLSASSTTTNTTLSTSGGQVFISPGINMSSAVGGKKPPIIIVSNKKGMPLSMSRGGSIIRTLPYGSANLLSTLRPNILKAATSKSSDTTSTTSSTSTKSSASVSGEKKATTLSELMAEGTNDQDEDQNGDGKTTSEEGTQSGPPPKMPVIVLPSLGVRSARPVSKQPAPSSSSTTSITCGSTVVIMPTKPVISMGNKRPPKNPKKKPNNNKSTKGMDSIGVGVGTDTADDRRKGTFSLLSASRSLVNNSNSSNSNSNNSNNKPSTNSNSSSTQSSSSGMSDSASQASQSNADKPAAESQATQPSQTTQMDGQTNTGSQMRQQNTGNAQTAGQSQPSAFPDLNHMWQANFGSAPPTGPPQSSMTGGMNSAPPPGAMGYPSDPTMGRPGMMSANMTALNGPSDNSSGDPNAGVDMSGKGVNQPNANANMADGGGVNSNSNNMSYGNPAYNGSSGNNHHQPMGNSGSMGNPFMPPSSNSPYGMGGMMQGGSMNPYMPPPMNSSHPGGYMQPFNPNMPVQNQPSQHGGNNSMMFGSSSSNQQPSPFGSSPSNQSTPFGSSPSNPSTPFGSSSSSNQSAPPPFGSSYGMNNQSNQAPPPYGNSVATPGSGAQYQGQGHSNPSHQPFGFQAPSMNSYGSTPTSSSPFSPQQQQPMRDQQSFPPLSSSAAANQNPPPPSVFNSHAPQDYNNPTSLDHPMNNSGSASNASANNGNSVGGPPQFPPQHNQHQHHHQQQQQQQQANHPLQDACPPTSTPTPSSVPTTLSIPSYHGASALAMDSKRDNSPYSLTLLGSETTNTVTNSTSKPKRNRGSSKSSKNTSSSSSSSSSSHSLQARESPNTMKMPKYPNPNPGATLSIPDPSSPRNATATPDRQKPSASSNNPLLPPSLSDQVGAASRSAGAGGGLSHLSSPDPLGPPPPSSSSGGLNIPSLPNPLSNLPAFRPLISSPMTDSTVTGPHFGGIEAGLGGSAFRAHPASSFSANPQPFRLDGAGGISGMPGASGLGYNSGMSAFSSPSSSMAGAYGAHNAFGAYGTGYSNPSGLPFSSSSMVPPQAMMGYPQASLGYPSMSSLMMGAPPAAAPPPMGSSMWPMVPPSMMGGAYSYPHHPSSMGFTTPGFDGQGFGN